MCPQHLKLGRNSARDKKRKYVRGRQSENAWGLISWRNAIKGRKSAKWFDTMRTQVQRLWTTRTRGGKKHREVIKDGSGGKKVRQT